MKILISHVFGTWNKGDWVLFQEVVEILKLSFTKEVEFSAITRDPSAQKNIFRDIAWYQRIDSSFRESKILRVIEIIFGLSKILLACQSKFLFKFMSNYEESLHAIDSADLVVMCPGGYWDSSHPSFLSNLINLSLLVARNKKIIWAPQSIERISHPFLEKWFAKLLNKAELVFTRERESYNYVISLGVKHTKVLEVPDLAFYHNINNYGWLSKSSLDLDILNNPFITCTALKWHFPQSSDPLKQHEEYIRSIAETASFLAKSRGLPTILVRQIGNSKEGKGDIDVLKKIQELSNGSTFLLEEDLHPDVLIKLISKSVFLIGTRMHSNIFAFLSETPVVAISYQRKTNGIMKMMGLEDYVLPINNISPQSLIEMSEKVILNREALSSKIKNKTDDIRKNKDIIIEEIRKLYVQ
jgi:colanic acid/amylovoran biosynthesis protein